MVEIKSLVSIITFHRYKHIYCVLLWVFVSLNAFSQNTPGKPGTTRIEILHADSGEQNIGIDPDLTRFIGSVKIKHNDTFMYCDSAYYYKTKNQVKAFSKVHIMQGDTLNLYGNYLFYDGSVGNAFVRDNVELIDKETHLYTDSLNYDVKNRIARYNDKGRITNAKNTLTSVIGVYYATENLFHFKDSVKIVNPEYVMKADTMDYNTKTETAFFTGPTRLVGDSLNLYCEKGWYNTKEKVSSLWKKAVIDNRKQIIHGDSLFYNDSTGYGESFRNVVIEDTTNHLAIEGNYAWYYKQPEKFLVTNRAVFIQISKSDSLFLHADTISAITIEPDSLKSYRLMRAFHGCRIYSKGLQAKCDSLSYSFRDSVIRLYTYPVLWSEENQLTSDSMAVFTKNQQTDRLELYNAAFIASQVDTIRFNQIKGRSLTGYFKNNELYKIDIKGNGESNYYLLDGENVAGRNQSQCANIEVLLKDGKISEIYEYQSPAGFIDPPLPAIAVRLEGFKWLDNLRPKKKADIFKK
jgi:lipopolysaccharide export system protein LptA